jgi:hypothetical protein
MLHITVTQNFSMCVFVNIEVEKFTSYDDKGPNYHRTRYEKKNFPGNFFMFVVTAVSDVFCRSGNPLFVDSESL